MIPQISNLINKGMGADFRFVTDENDIKLRKEQNNKSLNFFLFRYDGNVCADRDAAELP